MVCRSTLDVATTRSPSVAATSRINWCKVAPGFSRSRLRSWQIAAVRLVVRLWGQRKGRRVKRTRIGFVDRCEAARPAGNSPSL